MFLFGLWQLRTAERRELATNDDDLTTAVPLAGANALRAPALWTEGRNVSTALGRLRGAPLRLRFHMVAPCQLFSFQFVQ